MAAKDERAPIGLFDPAAPEAPGPTVSARFDEATLRLARLIGRQIAREEFERRGKKPKQRLKLRSVENRHDNREELTRVHIIRIIRN